MRNGDLCRPRHDMISRNGGNVVGSKVQAIRCNVGQHVTRSPGKLLRLGLEQGKTAAVPWLIILLRRFRLKRAYAVLKSAHAAGGSFGMAQKRRTPEHV